VRHRKNKLLVVLLVFVLLDFSAAHAVHLNILRLHGHLRVLESCDRFEHEMLLHSEMPVDLHMFAAKEQNFKFCNFSTWSLIVTVSQPIMTPNNFHFIQSIDSIPLLNTEMLISETAVINIYMHTNSFCDM
jgi:hypothetical protein